MVGLRDRAILGTLTYTGARVGALTQLRIKDFQEQGKGRLLLFVEKGGKHRTIPVRQDLEEWIAAYIEAAGIADDHKNAPLFRSAYYRCRRLTERGVSDHTIRMIVKRRLADAGLPAIISPHSFRVMVVTNLLSQNVPIDDVQYLAGHANSQSTQLYDRRRRRVARTIVDLIAV